MNLPAILNITSGTFVPRREVVQDAVGLSTVGDLMRVLWYQRRLIISVLVLFVAAASLYLATAERVYKATASLLIDIRQEDPLQKQRPGSDAQTETTAIESQVQLLTSDAIASAVVRRLGLATDPEFIEDNSALPQRLLRQAVDLLLGSDDRPPTEQENERNAIDRLIGSVVAGRVGRTYVVSVSVLSRNPTKAAVLANAFANAYTEDQLNARLAAADRSADWLRSRAAELRQQSLAADRAVLDYTSQTNRERVELRALETTAQTYRTLFETFLSQYATTLQQQSFPISFARVVTPAQPPRRKSYPRTTLILLGSLIGGLGLGWLAGYVRESLHRPLRFEREVEDLTGLRSIGALPEIAQRRRSLLARLTSSRGHAKGLVGWTSALLQVSRLYPASRFAHTIKNVKAALELELGGQPVRIVSVLSVRPGEGKTVLSANLAQHIAKSGARTILIDLDCEHPTLTDTTFPANVPKSTDTVDKLSLQDPLFVDEESGLAFLAVSAVRRGANLAETLTAPAFRVLVERLRQRFDWVVIDLPCLQTITDARAVSEIVNCFVLVCEAERTKSDALTRAISLWDAGGLSPIVGYVWNRLRVPHTSSALLVSLPHRAKRSASRAKLPQLETVT